jgi:thiamine biosynthesis lipoprotein
MNRREFFRPKHLAQSAGTVLGAVAELQDHVADSALDTEASLLRFTRRAMATEFEIALPFGTAGAHGAAQASLDLIDALESQLTVYRDASEMCRVNQLAPEQPINVERRLFELLELCQQLHTATEGAFDIAAGALIKAWGFFRGPARVPEQTERLAALERVGMQHVSLDAAGSTVRFHRPGLEINLGSIGKGHALDRVAELLRGDWNVASALLHGGHSSVYAMGYPPGDERGWLLGVSHPWKPDRRLATVRLRNRGMGTSAASYRHLEWQGKKLGHILDPRTGWPAEGIASATAIAPTAAEADALATAFYINGVCWTQDYVAAHPDVSAVLLADSASEVKLFGKDVSADQ